MTEGYFVRLFRQTHLVSVSVMEVFLFLVWKRAGDTFTQEFMPVFFFFVNILFAVQNNPYTKAVYFSVAYTVLSRLVTSDSLRLHGL